MIPMVLQNVAELAQVSNPSLIGPLLVAGLTGVIVTVGNIFGNKKLNDVNREKYEILANNIMESKCQARSGGIDEQLKTIIGNQEIMSERIDHNTKITEEQNGRIALDDELDSVKKDALKAAHFFKDKNIIAKLVIIKANSMIEFFLHLLNDDIDELRVSNIKTELQVQIIKVKRNWSMALGTKNKGFIQYFYEVTHKQHIDSFFVDLCWLFNPQRKINNINVERELKLMSIKFFRFSMESLLASWESYKLDNPGNSDE